MGSGLFYLTTGRTQGYLLFGAGLMHARNAVNFAGGIAVDRSGNGLGVNLGGGVKAFVNDHDLAASGGADLCRRSGRRDRGALRDSAGLDGSRLSLVNFARSLAAQRLRRIDPARRGSRRASRRTAQRRTTAEAGSAIIPRSVGFTSNSRLSRKRPPAMPAAQADRRTGADHCCHGNRDAADHVAGAGAERHADADLAALLGDRVIQHAVESDGGKHQRDHGEEQRERGQQPFAKQVPADEAALRLDRADPEVRARQRESRGAGPAPGPAGCRLSAPGSHCCCASTCGT